MRKLRILAPKKLIKIIKKLGFRLDHKTGSHFIFYDAKTKRRVVIPFHSKDLPKGTIISILKQAGITKEELEKFFWYPIVLQENWLIVIFYYVNMQITPNWEFFAII